MYMCKKWQSTTREKRYDEENGKQEENKKMDASARDALCDVMYDEQKHKSFISA